MKAPIPLKRPCSYDPEKDPAGMHQGMHHCPECGMMVVGRLPHLITDGTICLACGADGSAEHPPDPDCKYCSFQGEEPPEGWTGEDESDLFKEKPDGE